MKKLLTSAIALTTFTALPSMAEVVPEVHAKWSRIFVITSATRRCSFQPKEDIDLQLVLLGYPLSSHAYYEQKMSDEIQAIFDKNPNFCSDVAREIKDSGTKTTKTQEGNDPHKLCLDARDYEGCIRVKTGSKKQSKPSSTENIEEKCLSNGWCIANNGRDRFGLKKLTGWMYKELNNGDVYYYNPTPKRIPHKADDYRYIVQEQVVRFYRQPTSGSDPITTTIGNSTTTCTGYMNSVQCSTRDPITLTTPGTKPRPGMNISREQSVVVDCIDKTRALYIEGRLKGNWDKIKGKHNLLDQCSRVRTMSKSSMKL
jgi:hypothetical protein